MVCKWVVLVIFVVLLCPTKGAAEITRADLQELKTDLKQYMDVRFSALEAKMEALGMKIEAVEMKIGAVEMKIEALERELTIVEWMIGGILIIVVAVLGLPQFAGMMRERKERGYTEAIERRLAALEKQLAT